jgi:hypothetical protein
VSADLIFPMYCHNGIPHLENIFCGKGLQIIIIHVIIKVLDKSQKSVGQRRKDNTQRT